MTFATKINKGNSAESEYALNKILGFLRGETCSKKEEIEKPLLDRIDVL